MIGIGIFLAALVAIIYQFSRPGRHQLQLSDAARDRMLMQREAREAKAASVAAERARRAVQYGPEGRTAHVKALVAAVNRPQAMSAEERRIACQVRTHLRQERQVVGHDRDDESALPKAA